MCWSTGLISVKACVGFSIFDPGSFLLTIFAGKVCVLLDSVQEFIQREAGVLQLNPVNFILTYQTVHMFEKVDSSNSQKMNDCSCQQVL